MGFVYWAFVLVGLSPSWLKIVLHFLSFFLSSVLTPSKGHQDKILYNVSVNKSKCAKL